MKFLLSFLIVLTFFLTSCDDSEEILAGEGGQVINEITEEPIPEPGTIPIPAPRPETSSEATPESVEEATPEDSEGPPDRFTL